MYLDPCEVQLSHHIFGPKKSWFCLDASWVHFCRGLAKYRVIIMAIRWTSAWLVSINTMLNNFSFTKFKACWAGTIFSGIPFSFSFFSFYFFLFFFMNIWELNKGFFFIRSAFVLFLFGQINFISNFL
jgi:hypothetical protein